MRNSAPAANYADNISSKSRFIPAPVLEDPGLPRELLDHLDALAGSHRRDGCIVRLRVVETQLEGGPG